MALVPPLGSPREKILVWGGPKVGKSCSHLSIAELYAATGTPGTFYIIDTDDAMPRMLYRRSLPNVVVLPAIGWSEYKAAGDKAVEMAGPEDWVIVDFVDRAWTAVRDWYFDVFLAEAPEEYFTRKKKEQIAEGRGGRKNRLGLYEEIDWDVVNPEYNSFIKPLIGTSAMKPNLRSHLFLVCEEKDVWEAGKPTGATKPGGQAGLQYQVHSLIKLDKVKRGRIMNNVGTDRERPDIENEAYDSFALEYLCKCAGWSMMKGGEKLDAE